MQKAFRLILGCCLLSLMGHAESFEERLSVGPAFNARLDKTEDGYYFFASIEVQSLYSKPLRIELYDVQLVLMNGGNPEHLAVFLTKPLMIPASADSVPARQEFEVEGRIPGVVNPSVFFEPASIFSGVHLMGNFKVLQKAALGWVGVQGMAFDQPIAADLFFSDMVPAPQASRVVVDFFPARHAHAGDEGAGSGSVSAGNPFDLIEVQQVDRLEVITRPPDVPRVLINAVFSNRAPVPLTVFGGRLEVYYKNADEQLMMGTLDVQAMDLPASGLQKGVMVFSPKQDVDPAKIMSLVAEYFKEPNGGVHSLIIKGLCDASIGEGVFRNLLRNKYPFQMQLSLAGMNEENLPVGPIFTIKGEEL